MIGFTTPFSGCRRLLITEPWEGGSIAAPFPWTPSLAHRPGTNLSRKENLTQNKPLPLRLILCWNQIAFSGSSCIGIKLRFQAHFRIGKCSITVVIDGVSVGHPVYGNFRSDIANLFPGYANSAGAVGFFHLNTTTLANGVHTIFWVATDDAVRTDGIGSRFFTVLN